MMKTNVIKHTLKNDCQTARIAVPSNVLNSSAQLTVWEMFIRSVEEQNTVVRTASNITYLSFVVKSQREYFGRIFGNKQQYSARGSTPRGSLTKR